MKPLVLASLESPDGTPCIDISQEGAGFGRVACRRDPGDGHGWRTLDAGPVFAGRAAAERDARANHGWTAG